MDKIKDGKLRFHYLSQIKQPKGTSPTACFEMILKYNFEISICQKEKYDDHEIWSSTYYMINRSRHLVPRAIQYLVGSIKAILSDVCQ